MLIQFVILSMLMAAGNEEIQDQSIVLQADRTVVIGAEWNRPVYQGIKCDIGGRLYFRLYDHGNNKPPVVRVNANGEGAVKFALPTSPELKTSAVYDFTVSTDGVVYQLAQIGDRVYVIKFSNEGDPSMPVLLLQEFFAAHAVPLSDNRLLVIGTKAAPDASNKHRRRPFAAVFDDSGRVLTEITGLKEESALHQATSKTDDSLDEDNEMSPSILLGTVEGGPDGLVYTLQVGNPGHVLVLDSNGKKKRDLRVNAPLKTMSATAMHVARGRIALLFVEQADKPIQDTILYIIDATTGEHLRSYDVTDIGSGFACYTGDSVSFLSSKGGKLAIKTADLRK